MQILLNSSKNAKISIYTKKYVCFITKIKIKGGLEIKISELKEKVFKETGKGKIFARILENAKKYDLKINQKKGMRGKYLSITSKDKEVRAVVRETKKHNGKISVSYLSKEHEWLSDKAESSFVVVENTLNGDFFIIPFSYIIRRVRYSGPRGNNNLTFDVIKKSYGYEIDGQTLEGEYINSLDKLFESFDSVD